MRSLTFKLATSAVRRTIWTILPRLLLSLFLQDLGGWYGRQQVKSSNFEAWWCKILTPESSSSFSFARCSPDSYQTLFFFSSSSFSLFLSMAKSRFTSSPKCRDTAAQVVHGLCNDVMHPPALLSGWGGGNLRRTTIDRSTVDDQRYMCVLETGLQACM